MIIANVQGVGTKTVVKDLVYGASNTESMCQSISIINYGKIECLTQAKEIPTSSDISIKLGDDSVVGCGNSDTLQCQYH